MENNLFQKENKVPNHILLEKQAYILMKEKGKIGAILFCEETIQDKLKQINEMNFYDGERIDALHNSIMDWGAIRSRIETGFN